MLTSPIIMGFSAEFVRCRLYQPGTLVKSYQDPEKRKIGSHSGVIKSIIDEIPGLFVTLLHLPTLKI